MKITVFTISNHSPKRSKLLHEPIATHMVSTFASQSFHDTHLRAGIDSTSPTHINHSHDTSSPLACFFLGTPVNIMQIVGVPCSNVVHAMVPLTSHTITFSSQPQ